MQPAIWKPPIELNAQEELVLSRIRRAKLFVFLRHHRHELFDEAFQPALAIGARLSGDFAISLRQRHIRRVSPTLDRREDWIGG